MQPAAQLALATATLAAAGSHRMIAWFFKLGLLGLLLVSTVDSSFVPLPIPGVSDIMVILYAAGHANLILLVLLATLGSAAGGLFSYQVGQAGGLAFLEKHVPERIFKTVTGWVESHAILAVAIPALLPPPMPLSPFVLAAGVVHMSRRKFMTAFTLSRLVRHSIAAWLGVRYGSAVLGIWNRFSARWGVPVLVGLWVFILVFAAVGIWKLYKTSREMNLKPGKRVAARVGKAVPRRAT